MKRFILIAIMLLSIFIISCSKKHVPESSVSATPKTKIITKRTPTPKVITLNDSVATKTPDGRLYYDLQGHRYWRNYNDGKYYLFYKDMYNNEAFKPH